MTGRLILMRHAAVDERYHGLCYGQSDVDLSPAGQQRSVELSERLSRLAITRVVHSGVQRTRFLAERLAKAIGCEAESSAALRERYYGDWEMSSWNDLHRRFGDEMLRVVSDPATFRPGGGETTFQMRDRVMAWYDALAPGGLTVAVTHGGPIAALRGTRRQLPVVDWLPLIPACGEFVTVQYARR